MYTCVSPCSFFFVDPITRVNVDDKSYKKNKNIIKMPKTDTLDVLDDEMKHTPNIL